MKHKTSRQEWRVQCPFFRCHGGTEIGCEGITGDSVIRLIFQNKDGRATQQRIFCNDKYDYCELYRAIYEQYEED